MHSTDCQSDDSIFSMDGARQLVTLFREQSRRQPDLIELTIERRGDGIAWVLMDGRWWALPKGAELGEPP